MQSHSSLSSCKESASSCMPIIVCYHRDLCTKQKQGFERFPAQIADCIMILPKQCSQPRSANSPFLLEQQQMNPVADIFEACTCLHDMQVVTAINVAALNMQHRQCRAVQSSSRKTSIANTKKTDDAFAKQQASLTAEQWQRLAQP